MVDVAALDYLNETVADVVAEALVHTALAQPRDAVDFLAQWLQRYVFEEEAEAARLQADELLVAQRRLVQARLADEAAVRDAKVAERQKVEDAREEFLQRLANPDTCFADNHLQELLDVAKLVSGAQAGYIGLVDEESAEEGHDLKSCVIRYTHASEQVLEQTLPANWGAVVDDPEAEAPYIWKPPHVQPRDRQVSPIELDHTLDSVLFGSYLATLLSYTTYYDAETFAGALENDRQRRTAAVARKEVQEKYDAQVAEAESNADAEAADPIEVPEVLEETEQVQDAPLQGRRRRMVLCLHTGGHDVELEESIIPMVSELCEVVCACRTRTELSCASSQIHLALDDEARLGAAGLISAARARVEEESEEAFAAENSLVAVDDERQKELLLKKYDYVRAAKTVVALKDNILEVKAWVVSTNEFMQIVAGLGFLYGYTQNELYPPARSKLKWDVLREVLNDTWFERIQTADLCAERKGLAPEQKLKVVRAMISHDFDESVAMVATPIAEVLLTLLQAGCAYRTIHLENQKTAWEERKEQEGDHMVGSSLEEIDDDYIE